MKREKISEAMGNISSRHIKEAAEFKVEEKPYRSKTPWVKWASLAACLALVFVSAIISGNIYINHSFDDVAMDMAVINYGPFILVPVLLISLINLSFLFTKRTTKTILIVNAISLVTVNILNVLGVYLYSDFVGINITGELPNILTGFNVGVIFFIITHTLLDRKTKTWWAKLLLWTLISVVSIVLACMVHNIILILFQGEMITIA